MRYSYKYSFQLFNLHQISENAVNLKKYYQNMNLTLVSLIANGILTRSPYFTRQNNFALISSSFTNSFSSILFSEHFSRILIDNTKFSSILSTAISLSSVSQDNIKFTNTYVDKGEFTEVIIKHCLFYECKSNENGGGILIGSSTSETKFTLSSSGFYKCQSSKGDSFYSETKSLQFENCWIDESANSAFYAKERNSLTFKQIIISNSKLFSTADIGSNNFKISNLNLSSNRETFSIISSGVDCEFCDISFNTGNTLFDLTVSQEFVLDYANLYQNNFQESIFNQKGRLLLSQCYFLNDLSKVYLKATSFTKISQSSFDQSEAQTKSKCPHAYLSDNTYNSTQTTLITYDNFDICWDKRPRTKAPMNISTSTILQISAIVGLALVVLFLFCKLCGNRGYNAKVPLLYTA